MAWNYPAPTRINVLCAEKNCFQTIKAAASLRILSILKHAELGRPLVSRKSWDASRSFSTFYLKYIFKITIYVQRYFIIIIIMKAWFYKHNVQSERFFRMRSFLTFLHSNTTAIEATTNTYSIFLKFNIRGTFWRILKF